MADDSPQGPKVKAVRKGRYEILAARKTIAKMLEDRYPVSVIHAKLVASGRVTISYQSFARLINKVGVLAPYMEERKAARGGLSIEDLADVKRLVKAANKLAGVLDRASDGNSASVPAKGRGGGIGESASQTGAIEPKADPANADGTRQGGGENKGDLLSQFNANFDAASNAVKKDETDKFFDE